ncbi:type II toxin-antitoxin system RelE/ParE family toxin (plasmid) [Microbulbifer sp. CnH-101-G]|uniref:type II toxin-antitoxin system RelE/ParE family toxin n=1 Tax=Microbulbifer sp. CnH-101-G TaxID=3243393 RepID=UPI0040392E56
MQGYKITNSAAEDVLNIARYGRKKWGAERAYSYTLNLYERFQWLADFPAAGAQRDDIGDGYRSYPHKSHVVYYTRLDREQIAILGVLHGKADPLRHFPIGDEWASSLNDSDS